MTMSIDPLYAEKYPLLNTLFGGYFHQDFDFDYGSPEDTIDAFLADVRPVDMSDFLVQNDALLENATDASLERTLAIMGNSFDYTTRDLNARQWLNYVAVRVRAKIGCIGMI